MKTVTLNDDLTPLLEQMSRDMAVPLEGLVNQAIFNWARLHGYAVTADAAASHLSEAPLPSISLAPAAQPPAPRARVSAPRPSDDLDRTSPELHLEPTTSPSTPVAEPDELGMTMPSMKKTPRIILVVGDRETIINTERFIIGRDVSCNLTIDAPRISRQHAVLTPGPDFVELEDLNSSNGTWINGERISKHELISGDEFTLGDVEMRIEFR